MHTPGEAGKIHRTDSEMMAGITISYLVVITLEKTKTSNVGLVDYLVLDEKPLLLLGGMLKPSVRYGGLEQR